MNIDQFISTIPEDTPPSSISPYLKALWHDKKGNWKMAHNIAQDIADNDGSWIHAYLHRKEGDSANAGYWYRKAGKQMPNYSLEKEWNEIVNIFLNDEK